MVTVQLEKVVKFGRGNNEDSEDCRDTQHSYPGIPFSHAFYLQRL